MSSVCRRPRPHTPAQAPARPRPAADPPRPLLRADNAFDTLSDNVTYIDCDEGAVVPNIEADPPERCEFDVIVAVRTFGIARGISFAARLPGQEWPRTHRPQADTPGHLALAPCIRITPLSWQGTTTFVLIAKFLFKRYCNCGIDPGLEP